MSNKNNQKNQSNPRYMTTSEAAKLLGVTTNTVRRWIIKGKIRGKKIIGRWKVYREDIEKILQE